MAGTWEEAGRFAPDLRLCAHHGPAPCSGATSCAAEEATVPRAGDPQPGDMEERVHRRGPVPPSR
jgi:hypothetical protein